MNQNLKNHLIEARLILVEELQSIQSQIQSIDTLLLGTGSITLRRNTAKGSERRKGGVKQVLEALKSLKTGTIRQVANKVQELYPVNSDGEIGLYSKTSMYLKRLLNGGDIECDESIRPKKYSIKQTNNINHVRN